MQKPLSHLSLALFILLIFITSALAVEPVGIVKSVVGDVYLKNATSSMKAVANMRLNEGDRIQTGSKSSVGLIFKDDTVVSLGPKSEMAVDEFLFDPANEQLSFVTRLVKGTFSFVSGQVAKLAPEKVKIETPDATLGVRGTKFLVKVD